MADNLDAFAGKLWDVAKAAIQPLGDDRYYFNSHDDREAVAAIRDELLNTALDFTHAGNSD